VNSYKDPRSPWGVRVFYEDTEFESMMDEVRERGGADTFTVGEGVDVDLVLLRVYGVSPMITEMPEDILGRTSFFRNGDVILELNRDLTIKAETLASARHRLRSTLGHECGHITLHRHLYCVDQTPSLFAGDVRESAGVMCRKEDIHEKPGYRETRQWWEYHANRGMASLLLPATLFRREVEERLRARNLPTMRDAVLHRRAEEVIEELASVFDVSMEMILYRLQERRWLPRDSRQVEISFQA
jgi:Zn-dependent peptidase ImmA (M78 family)